MYTVLIVEDELLERDFLESIVQDELSPEDLLYTCESGLQAIQLAKQHRPDVILMDLMITETDGLTAIEEIRKFLPHACISILTACSNFSYAQKAINLKVFEYLLKPVKPTAVKEIFCKMLKAVDNSKAIQSSDLALKEPEERVDRNYFIDESVKFINEHFRDKLTLEMVASKVFVNPKYFSHVFKKEMGVSFTEYVIGLRIQYACRMLETTQYPAYRISLECGFSDPSYFNRVFCSQMNMTPQSYRKLAHTSKAVAE